MENDFSVWAEEKETIEKNFKLDSSSYHFLFIGIGFKRKGLKPLLLGLAALKEKNFTLSIVGSDKNIKRYMHLVERLGLSDKVFFFGMRKDIRNFLKVADCLVIPSFYDPFANVTLEALAMGLFVITSKYNGGKEVLNSSNGVVIEELLDVSSVKESLELALKTPKTVSSAKETRQSIKHLTFSNQLNKLIDTLAAD